MGDTRRMSNDMAEAVAAMILERKKAREADWKRRKESTVLARAEFAERRAHGLVARKKAKLRGVQGRLI